MKEEIRALPPQFPDVRTAVMPALDLAQEELGYLTPEAMSEVATALDLDPGYVEGVATFYTLFHTEPVGRHRLYICTNISCKLRGADALVEHAMQQVGVKTQDDVSADGLFSVEAVECLGSCEYAPVMRLDRAFHHDLTPEKIDALLAERRAPVPSPPRGAISGRSARERAVLNAPGAQREGGEGGSTPPAPEKKARAPRKKKTDA